MKSSIDEVIKCMRMINAVLQDDPDPAICCAACANFAGNLAYRADVAIGDRFLGKQPLNTFAKWQMVWK